MSINPSYLYATYARANQNVWLPSDAGATKGYVPPSEYTPPTSTTTTTTTLSDGTTTTSSSVGMTAEQIANAGKQYVVDGPAFDVRTDYSIKTSVKKASSSTNGAYFLKALQGMVDNQMGFLSTSGSNLLYTSQLSLLL